MNIETSAGLIIGTLWLLKNSLSTRKQIELFFLSQLVVICLGWIGFNRFYLIHIFRIILIVLIIYAIRKIAWSRIKVTNLISIMILSSGLGHLFYSESKRIFFILTLGYDNSSHIGFLFRTWVSGKFEYGIGDSGRYLVPYSNLANAYPSMQMETWATILKLVGLNIESTRDLISAFALMLFITILILIAAINSFYDVRGTKSKYIIIFCNAIFLLGGSASSVIWSGFPPTIWGILVAVLIFRYILLTEMKVEQHILFILIGLVTLLYSYQIFFFPMLVLIPIMFLRNLSKIDLKQNKRLLLIFLVVVLLGVTFMRKTFEIREYTLAFGGILFPSYFLIFGFIVILISLSIIDRSGMKGRIEIFGVLLSTLAFSGILIIYSHNSGRGIYYPVKVLYLFLTLSICYITYAFANSKKRDLKKIKVATLFLSVIIVIDFASAKSNPLGWTSVNLFREWKQVQSGDISAFGSGCLDQIFRNAETSTHFGYQKTKFVNYVPGTGWQADLLSRWSNSLEGRIDDLVLELAIPMGSSKIQSEVVQSFKVKYPDIEVLPIGMSKLKACSFQ